MGNGDQSTPETTRRVLLEHGVPRALLDSATASGSPFRLLSWGKPDFQRVSELESLAPGLAGICPLAEEDGAAIVGFLPASNQCVRYYYEDGPLGDTASEIVGTGYHQFAATILLQFEEAGLRDEFDEAARILVFRQVDELRRLLDTEPYDDEAVEGFRTSLAAR